MNSSSGLAEVQHRLARGLHRPDHNTGLEGIPIIKDLLQEQVQIAVVSGTPFGDCTWCNEFVNHDDGTLRCSSFSLRKGSRGDGHQLVPEVQDVALLQSETEEL